MTTHTTTYNTEEVCPACTTRIHTEKGVHTHPHPHENQTVHIGEVCRMASCPIAGCASATAETLALCPTSSSILQGNMSLTLSIIADGHAAVPTSTVSAPCAEALFAFSCFYSNLTCAYGGGSLPPCRAPCQAVHDACGWMVMQFGVVPASPAGMFTCENYPAASWPSCAEPVLPSSWSALPSCLPPPSLPAPPTPPPPPGPPLTPPPTLPPAVVSSGAIAGAIGGAAAAVVVMLVLLLLAHRRCAIRQKQPQIVTQRKVANITFGMNTHTCSSSSSSSSGSNRSVWPTPPTDESLHVQQAL